MASFTASAAAVAPVARARVAANRARPTSVRSSSASLTVRKTERRAQRVVAPRAMSEIAQTAMDLDEETITAGVAALLGLGAGLGIPIFFVWQENRDKERLEEIRELNRATLKATGEQMSPEEIAELRPSRYLDRREFKDDD
jgi:hypothetical protein